jgi:hypothetical protein
MAQLGPVRSSCCAPEKQSNCCESDQKEGCCPSHQASCGCDAGRRESKRSKSSA